MELTKIVRGFFQASGISKVCGCRLTLNPFL
jgi:hypothetical protein